ncbi:MAG: UrcA family protein [Caulobacteraceae bacterium]
MHSSRVSPAFAIALTTGLLIAVQAMAQSTVSEVIVRAPPAAGVEVKRETVKLADLDLKGQAGAETLVGRIRAAAGRVCLPSPTHPAALKDVADYQKCRTEAVSQAVKDSGSAMVEQVFKRTGD